MLIKAGSENYKIIYNFILIKVFVKTESIKAFVEIKFYRILLKFRNCVLSLRIYIYINQYTVTDQK